MGIIWKKSTYIRNISIDVYIFNSQELYRCSPHHPNCLRLVIGQSIALTLPKLCAGSKLRGRISPPQPQAHKIAHERKIGNIDWDNKRFCHRGHCDSLRYFIPRWYHVTVVSVGVDQLLHLTNQRWIPPPIKCEGKTQCLFSWTEREGAIWTRPFTFLRNNYYFDVWLSLTLGEK